MTTKAAPAARPEHENERIRNKVKLMKRATKMRPESVYSINWISTSQKLKANKVHGAF